MPSWLRRASFDVTCHSKGSESLQHRHGAQSSGIFPRLSSHVVPIVNETIGIRITELPRGAATDTQSPESTHLMSKESRGSLAHSLTTPMKMAWALFQGLFTGSSSRVVLTFAFFELEWLISQVLLKV